MLSPYTRERCGGRSTLAERHSPRRIVSAHHTRTHIPAPALRLSAGTDTSTPGRYTLLSALGMTQPAKAAPVDCRLPACAPITALFTSRPWLVSNVLAPCLRWIRWTYLSALPLLSLHVCLCARCSGKQRSHRGHSTHIPSIPR